MTSELDVEKEIYKELGEQLKRMQMEGEIPADAIDWDSPKMNQTIYDANPNSRHRWYKFETKAICSKCDNEVNGSLILTKNGNHLEDTGGFILFSSGIICNDCLRKENLL